MLDWLMQARRAHVLDARALPANHQLNDYVKTGALG